MLGFLILTLGFLILFNNSCCISYWNLDVQRKIFTGDQTDELREQINCEPRSISSCSATTRESSDYLNAKWQLSGVAVQKQWGIVMNVRHSWIPLKTHPLFQGITLEFSTGGCWCSSRLGGANILSLQCTYWQLWVFLCFQLQIHALQQ